MPDFKEILGNEVLKEHFRTAIKQNKVSHAYILEGEKGSGKKMIAAAFAKILQCEERLRQAEGLVSESAEDTVIHGGKTPGGTVETIWKPAVPAPPVFRSNIRIIRM